MSRRFESFHSQDIENGHFDVVFQLGNEKLYAHKFMLADMSNTFAVMFSRRWKTREEAIKIESYSFTDFKEFLGHFYLSRCKLTNENIFTMLDMAEFYDVADMKVLCDHFLSYMMNLTPENVFPMFDISQKYSALPEFQSSINSFMANNLSILLDADSFIKIKKEMIKSMIDVERLLNSQEEKFFVAVYKWAELQAGIKQSSSENENFDLNKAIKEELADILPKIHFERMNLDFLNDFVVPKGFLFSYQELSKVLQTAKKGAIHVTVVSPNGKTLTGKLLCDPSMFSNIYDTLTSAKDSQSYGFDKYYQFWYTDIPRPYKTSQLKKNDNVEYYLTMFDDVSGGLSVYKTSELTKEDYLLAELDGDDGFKLTHGCKINTVRNF